MNKKLYFIIPVLVIILLISFSALCDLGGGQIAKEESDDTSEQAPEDNGQQEGEKKEQDQSEKDSGSSEVSGDVENKEETKGDDSKDSQSEKPTISLKIYEGPTYSQTDDICYYRIEATANGDPKPSIKFSRDDSNGAWGNNKVQINIKKGETYTLTATATNSEGSATDSLKLDWGCGDINSSGNNSGNQNNSVSNLEITDIIIGDVVDEHIEPADFLLIDSTYTCYPVMTIPPDGTETYNWSIAGGSAENHSFYVQWNTPSTPGWYTVTIDIFKEDGSFATLSKNFLIEELVGDPTKENKPPELGVISISGDGVTKQAIGEKTISAFEATEYWLSINATDPDGDNLSYIWTVTAGTVSNPDNSPPIWTTPSLGDDSSLKIILTVTVDDGRGGVVDKSADVLVTKRTP